MSRSSNSCRRAAARACSANASATAGRSWKARPGSPWRAASRALDRPVAFGQGRGLLRRSCPRCPSSFAAMASPSRRAPRRRRGDRQFRRRPSRASAPHRCGPGSGGRVAAPERRPHLRAASAPVLPARGDAVPPDAGAGEARAPPGFGARRRAGPPVRHVGRWRLSAEDFVASVLLGEARRRRRRRRPRLPLRPGAGGKSRPPRIPLPRTAA